MHAALAWGRRGLGLGFRATDGVSENQLQVFNCFSRPYFFMVLGPGAGRASALDFERERDREAEGSKGDRRAGRLGSGLVQGPGGGDAAPLDEHDPVRQAQELDLPAAGER